MTEAASIRLSGKCVHVTSILSFIWPHPEAGFVEQ